MFASFASCFLGLMQPTLVINETEKTYKTGSRPNSMAVLIVYSGEGIKPLDRTVDYLRDFDIVLTTPDTIYGQIRNYNKAAATIAYGTLLL